MAVLLGDRTFNVIITCKRHIMCLAYYE